MPSQPSKLISSRKQLAILIDPDKENKASILNKCSILESSSVDYILLGGSSTEESNSEEISSLIKANCSIPLIGFPGNAIQLNRYWDGLLYLSLIGSKNAQYLFEEQLAGTRQLINKEINLDIYPCAYALVDTGSVSNTAKVTQSKAILDRTELLERCLTARFLGMNHIYLEAGSGATESVEPNTVTEIKKACQPVFMIVGGGIKSPHTATGLWDAGADLIVVGNYFEAHPEKIIDFCEQKDQINAAIHSA